MFHRLPTWRLFWFGAVGGALALGLSGCQQIPPANVVPGADPAVAVIQGAAQQTKGASERVRDRASVMLDAVARSRDAVNGLRALVPAASGAGTTADAGAPGGAAGEIQRMATAVDDDNTVAVRGPAGAIGPQMAEIGARLDLTVARLTQGAKDPVLAINAASLSGLATALGTLRAGLQTGRIDARLLDAALAQIDATRRQLETTLAVARATRDALAGTVRAVPRPTTAPGAAVTAAPLPVPTDYDQFFAAPLGSPNDPGKYRYIGPIVGGRDPSKVDWSAFGATTAEQKRRCMVDYAQGRLKVGRNFGGLDDASGAPSAVAAAPAPAVAAGGGADGEQVAICNTPENKNIAPPSHYRNAVMAAIDKVIAAGTGLAGPGSEDIKDFDAYHAAVVDELRKQGFQAFHDGEEIAMNRPGDNFQEQFDISTWQGKVRRFYASFVKPADPKLANSGGGGAPTPAPAPAPTGGDDIAPSPLLGDVPGQKALCNSIENPNVAPKSEYRGAVNQAIDAVIASGRGLAGPGSQDIVSFDEYHRAVVSELRRRGYCAAHDGEELAIKRPGDGFNEQFDISTASNKVRRFYAAWIEPPSVGE